MMTAEEMRTKRTESGVGLIKDIDGMVEQQLLDYTKEKVHIYFSSFFHPGCPMTVEVHDDGSIWVKEMESYRSFMQTLENHYKDLGYCVTIVTNSLFIYAK